MAEPNYNEQNTSSSAVYGIPTFEIELTTIKPYLILIIRLATIGRLTV